MIAHPRMTPTWGWALPLRHPESTMAIIEEVGHGDGWAEAERGGPGLGIR